MSEQQPEFLHLPDDGWGARRIAFLRSPGRGTGEAGLLWLPGFNSVMTSSKAEGLAGWVEGNGRALTRFDYSGHGLSDGRFEDGTIGQWLADSLAAFDHLTAGPQIVLGSSMGGYLAMLLLEELKRREDKFARVRGAVLIAPAWNMTERLMWTEMPQEARAALELEGVWRRPSAYGDAYPITRRLIEEGRRHLIDPATYDPGCPTTILHGAADADVPIEGSRELVRLSPRRDLRLVEIPDGEHRLARPGDIALLFREIDALA